MRVGQKPEYPNFATPVRGKCRECRKPVTLFHDRSGKLVVPAHHGLDEAGRSVSDRCEGSYDPPLPVSK